jgi:hypothetical protein
VFEHEVVHTPELFHEPRHRFLRLEFEFSGLDQPPQSVT